MDKDASLAQAAAELRRRAEEQLRKRPPKSASVRRTADAQRLVHELQVHQLELEMQNEELRLARDALEAGLVRYSDLYDFAPVGYLTLDAQGTIREANLSAASLLGIERSRLPRRRIEPQISPADLPAFSAFLKKVFASNAREFCEVTLNNHGSGPVAVRFEATVAASRAECRLAVMDITERRQAEKDRLLLCKLEAMEILAGGIAHDFNNLLTVILLELEVIHALVPSGGDTARRLEGAKRASWTARGLIQELLAIATKGVPVRKPTNLAGVIQETVRSSLIGGRVQSEFFLPADLWLAEVDEGQIGQVFRNMVLNAQEVMAKGGVISIRAENVVLNSHESPPLLPGDYVRVSIVDQGGGIADDMRPKIFDPYFSTKGRGPEKGTGLGLTFCHSVVQRNGGAIVVESEKGVGTTFHIYLAASRNFAGPENAAKRNSPEA